MVNEELPQELLQEYANSVVRGNKNFLNTKRFTQATLELDSNLKKTRRDFIDCSIKSDIQKGLISFECTTNTKDNGFGNKYFEHTGETIYGQSVLIVKRRSTLINGFEEDRAVHLVDYARKNSLSTEKPIETIDFMELLEKKDNSLPLAKPEKTKAFLALCYDFEQVSGQITYLGIYTLDSKQGAIELQDFSDCIRQAYTVDDGEVGKERMPEHNNYQFQVREQEGKGES